MEKTSWEEVFLVLSNPVKRVGVSHNEAQDQNTDSQEMMVTVLLDRPHFAVPNCRHSMLTGNGG